MRILPVISFLLPFMFLTACGGSDDVTDLVDEEEEVEVVEEETEETEETVLSVDPDLFAVSSLVSAEIVDCTLSNGEASSCYSITVTGFPADRTELGDFCPESIDTTADGAGKWFDGGLLYDLTGEFVSNLDTFYGDDNWDLIDETSAYYINITDTQEACEAAARPDVDVQYQNHCVQCEISYYSDVEGEGIASTYLIPITPVLRDGDGGDITGNNVGVAFNGVNLAGAAPVDAILGAYTIAAFDDCVGHINPNAGYHYHGANHGDGDCPGIDFESDGHAGAFAYAMDGFAIHSMLDESGEEETDLDDCRGHSDDVHGYHYHSAGPGENAFVGCFSGEIAQ